jgi:AraC-like DNA-binding protein
MRLDNAGTGPLLAALPPLIRVKGNEEGGAPWLRLTVQHVIDELDADRPGIEAVVGRLADILFIGAIRSYLAEGLALAESGWLAAVRDRQIGRAMALLHSAPARPWTVELLAARVALSRSAFASKFTQLVGEPPLHYLTRVRLDAAARRLRGTNDKLSVVAAAAGYESAAAFIRAFERHLGVSPGEYRRAHRGPRSGGR